MSDERSYEQGVTDGIQLWGDACGKQSSCTDCPLIAIKGANMSCQEFARQFPAKMKNLLREIKDKSDTYYGQFCSRFENNTMTVEELAEVSCRKVVFEGYMGCDKEGQACVDCWLEHYEGDVTEFFDDDSDNTDISSIIE